MADDETHPLEEKLDKLGKKLDRLINLARAAGLPDDRVLVFNHRGKLVKLYLPNAAVDGVQAIILRNADFFEAPLLNRIKELGLIGPDTTVFDIGANIGNHTVFFSKILRAKQVYAFEPQEYCVHVLERNLSLNGLEAVEVACVGVGAASGQAVLDRFQSRNHGAAAFSPAEEGDVDMIALDDFVAQNMIDEVSFVKVDVEGHAAEVLQGAEKTLSRFKPPLWAELLPRFNEVDPVLELISPLGYSVAEKLSRTDYLFHHKDHLISGV